MEVKSEYLIASFFSFLIHALIILYLMDFFYSEKQIRPVLSQTVDVNLIFEEEIIKPKKLPEAVKVPSVNQVVDKDINIEQDIKPTNTNEINISINDLIKIDKAESTSSRTPGLSKVPLFSNLLIPSIGGFLGSKDPTPPAINIFGVSISVQ